MIVLHNSNDLEKTCVPFHKIQLKSWINHV